MYLFPNIHRSAAVSLYRRWTWSWILTCLAIPNVALAQQITFPGETWQLSTPELVLVDSAKLAAAVTALDQVADSVEEMMVVRNGRLIWQGSRPDYSQQVYSMTKSFTSTAMGLLVDDGKITIDTLAKDYVPALADRYANATLRHFATHTSGYLAEDEHVPLSPGSRIPDDPFAPDVPLFEPPGSRFAYTGTAMDMWANTLTRVAGESLEDLFNRRIADPIGMNPDEFDWQGFVAGDGTFVAGGSGYPDHGVIVSANNAARLGLLYLNYGNWSGAQLLSRQWVEQATQVQVPSTLPVDPKSAGGTDGPGEYGFGWWVDPLWHEAIGDRSNYTSVSPATGFVMARLGSEPGNNGISAFQSALLDAVIPAVWDELGDGRWDESSELSGTLRWKTESGMIPEIYPTHKAIVRTNTVTVASQLDVGEVTVESGQLLISESGRLRSGDQILVENDATLAIDGPLVANRLTVDGNVVADSDFAVQYFAVRSGNVKLRDSQRDYLVTERLSIGDHGAVQFHISDDSWDSPLQLVGPTTVASLSGDLELEISEAFNPELLEGKTLNLFDWSERLPSTVFERILVPPRISYDASLLYTTGEIMITSVLDQPLQPGDFDGNSLLDVDDVNALSRQIAMLSTDLYYDLNDDGAVALDDLTIWVHDLKRTYFGDANLDGEFNSQDFTVVFLAGEYEDAIEDNSGWSEGDWNSDLDFTSQDMITAFLDGGYEAGPLPASVVPEPSSTWLLLPAALFAVLVILRKRNAQDQQSTHVQSLCHITKHRHAVTCLVTVDGQVQDTTGMRNSLTR